MTKEEILRVPVNFLYVYSNPQFEALVKKYISSRAAATIARKRQNGVTVLKGAYSGTANLQKAYQEISDAIVEQYGITPQEMLQKLLNGETVAGKNWREGVFGIGATKVTAYKENPNVLVDTDTGKLIDSGAQTDDAFISGGTPIYKNKGIGKNKTTYISGYSYEIDGKVYTTKRASDGKYYAYSYGDSEGMYSALGTEMKSADFSSVWENIETAVPFLQKFIEWLASIFNISIVKQQDVTPSQSEFVTNDNNNIEMSSVIILGAVALGSYLLMKK